MNKYTKISYSLCIFILFLLILCSCNQTENWESVTLQGHGSIKVPEDWEYSVIDGFLYFSSNSSGESKNTLVQYSTGLCVNEYFCNIEDREWVIDENYSNGASVIKYKVFFEDDSSTEIYCLRFGASTSLEFYCLDPSVSEDTLKKIANSYTMNNE